MKAALFISCILLLATQSITQNTDVIIVGSGLSGMDTAFRLLEGGLNVMVFEAYDRVGGRVRSDVYLNESFSTGGTFALFENTALLALAHAVGCQPFTPLIIPKQLALHRLATKPYLFLKLWLLGYSFSAQNDYWNVPGAAYYDSISLATWLQQQRNLFWDEESVLAVRDWMWLIENFPRNLNISTLHASIIVYQRTKLINAEGLYTRGVYRWEGGTGVLAECIRNAIEDRGGIISTTAPVASIDTTGTFAVVTLTNGTSYTSKKVVVATSLISANGITYSPALPSDYTNLGNSIVPSDAGSVEVVNIWSYRWFIPEGNTVLPDPSNSPACGAYGEIFEVGPTNSIRGILRNLIIEPVPGYDCLGSFANVVQSNKDWLKSIYIHDAGVDSAYVGTFVWDWRARKDYIPGVTYYYPPTGSIAAYGDGMRLPVGKIHFGGSERAMGGLHWMEGAVQRGNDVACEILVDLGRVPNCTVYNSWLKYMGLLAQQTLASNNYTANINRINTMVCLLLQQSGYSCGNYPFRVTNLSLLEIPIWGQIQFVLLTVQQLINLANQVAHNIGQLLGPNGPFL